MEIGQLPVEVVLPTLHDQVTTPVEFAVLSPSPDAVEGPDLYSTSIEHRAFGDVLIDTVAVLSRGTEAVRELTLTGSFAVRGDWLDFDFGFADGVGVADETAESDGAAAVSIGLAASSTNPKPAGGGVVAGVGWLPPRVDPMAAAMITTAMRMPIHAGALQPVLVEVGGAGADVAGSGDAVFGLERDV